MSKQVIVYEKENGVITQVMSFGSITNIDPIKLGLDKIFDLSKVGFLIEDDKIYVNIKKDRIFNGKITQISNKVSHIQESTSLFEEVQYKKLPEHVALITPWNRECGISNYSMDLVDNLNCRISIFCGKEDPSDSKNPLVKVIPCWTNRDNSYGYLVELLKKNNVDVVHVQYNHDMLNAGQLKIFGQELKEAGIRSIMTLHSTKGGVDIFGKCFDTMIVHTDLSADDIIGENVLREQIEIIPIGSHPLRKNKDKKIACIEKNIDHTRPIIVNFGFLLPQKGIKEQIRAIDLIKRTTPNILLLVVCSIHKLNQQVSEKYLEECQEIVNNLGLNDNVIFISEYLPYDEIFDYLHCADIISLPYVHSAAQANSSAGRTAIMANRPVITSDVDIFVDLKNIIPQVESKNVDDLAETIVRILNNVEEQQTIIDNIKYFIEETSWQNAARKHERLYKSFGNIKIDIEGQVYSYFSASVVNRNLACALDDLGVNITLKSVNLAENKSYKLGDKTDEIVLRHPTNEVQVRHQFPINFKDWMGKTKVLYLPVETSVPDEWLDGVEDCDYIWVYSTHSKELIQKAGITKPVDIVRCGYDKNLFNESVIPIDLMNVVDSYTKQTVSMNDNTFVFMFIGHAQERKNYKTILKSYLTEFTSQDDVLFVTKSYDGGEVHKVILEITDYVVSVLGKPKDLLPKHLYIYEDTDPNVLPSYYKAANVLVQCSRAEGFGKPIIEAQALGIPSIAVNFGGPRDFCTDKNAFLVPFELVESSYHVQSKQGVSFWADTKIEDLRNTMRFCFNNPDEVKKRGKQALKDSKKWSMDEVAFDVIKFIKKYKLD